MARVAPSQAGERDKLVVIQSRPTVDLVDADGFPIDDPWATLATVFMHKRNLEDLGQSERLVANQVSANFDTEWEMVYRTDMDPEAIDVPKLRRLSYRGRVHDIVHAAMRDRPEGQHITLRTLTSTGVTA